ncbi:hypothetical protein DB30_02284 [Enhygromyxa salina]|uniref:HTH luxR-type domain-containing protein n=2 Tax=Enhygromyxa salina TaxID=215803 RepID=A0A0C2CL17_9BACT|nr:hypothetical protein DB30_02284 [Enhygromyxa salina]
MQMNAATTVAASTYELPLFAAAPPSYGPTPRGSFVSGLVASLTWTFNLDAGEQALAEQLLFGRPLGALARHFNVDAATAQRMCRELFTMTGADGREKLFELALRLTTMRAHAVLGAE